MGKMNDIETEAVRQARLQRLFALHKQVIDEATEVDPRIPRDFVEERVVSPGFARQFQADALRSLTGKPRA